MIKLFVSGFPLDMEEIELVRLISIYGEVSTVKIIRDRNTGLCKAYGFLEIISLEGAKNGIEAINGTKIGKKELFLNQFSDNQIKPELKRPSKTSSIPLKVNTIPETLTTKKKRPRIASNNK